MNFRTVIERLKTLNLPARAKADLAILWRHASRLVEKVIDFVVRHRKCSEAMLLGAVVAYLLSMVPIIGNFLALVALVTAASVGLMAELRQDLTEAFGSASPAA